ncbi:MAG: hypothetical protein ABL996_08080 [Micropepsaceae bacterium]
MMDFRWIVVFAALALSACATTSFERTTALQSGVEVSGSSVVVYSFLDVRKGVFGEKMLAMMNDQLVEQFKQRGVNARVVVYQYAEAEANPSALFLGVNRSMVAVPIKEYLKSQRPEEQKHGDKFRLMVFPAMVTVGAGIDSQITWTLADTSADKPVWTTKQETSRTIWWSNEEAPELRSKQFVDGVMKEMTKSGLFGAAALQQQQQQDEAKRKQKP